MGNGEPLVFVHGSASDHRTWHSQKEALAVLGAGTYDKMPETKKEHVQDNVESLKGELLGPGFLSLDAEQLQRVKKPTLLVNGEESIGLFHRLTDRL